MSHKRFTGWEPRRFVRVVREDRRIVGYEIETEPEWDEGEQALAQGFVSWTSNMNSLGIPWDEALDPDAVFEAGQTVVGPDGQEFHGVPYVDRSVEARERAAHQYQESKKDKPEEMWGRFWPVTRVD